MLTNLFKHLVGSKKPATVASPARLHIGGQRRNPGWHVFDVLPGEHVDFVGTCTDLGCFAESSIEEIYASHVIEHLGYQSELPRALAEFRRVLVPGGLLRVSVPDLTTLCGLFLDRELNAEERFEVMRMMFGGQMDSADFHRMGFNDEFLAGYLDAAGFTDIARVNDFGAFDDSSRFVFKGHPISLNILARKPREEPVSE